MNINAKDLNSLYLFRVLFEERNLSKAAKRMGLSQPAMSHRLNKLRNEFGDSLFVKAPRGLSITPVGEQYAPEIIKLVTEIESLYQSLQPEDFLQQKHKFNIFGTEIVEAFLMPDILSVTRQNAPNTQIAMFNTRGSLPKIELEKGICDIAIAGFFEDIPESFYSQFLCSYRFVVLTHKDNPKIKNKKLNVKQFTECEHVIVTLSGDMTGSVDKILASLGKQRKIVAGYSSFLAPQALLANEKDILFVCLNPVAELAVQYDKNLVYYECPVKLQNVDLIQVWHERTHHDPMRKWLRQEIKKSAYKKIN